MSTEPDYLRVRNWGRFQYRTDKRLPWIRSHDTLLEDYEYTGLSDAERGHIHGIWLLANRTKNKIPADNGWVRAAIRATRAPNLQLLTEKGFLEPWVPDSELPANERVPDALSALPERTSGAQSAQEIEIEIEKTPKPPNRNSRKTRPSDADKIRTMIRNGVITDTITLDAELTALGINGDTATELRALITTNTNQPEPAPAHANYDLPPIDEHQDPGDNP